MSIQSINPSPATSPAAAEPGSRSNAADEKQAREVFRDVVGQTFFSHLISAMRKTVDKPAYFHGGRAEEVFQSQLDQMLAENLSDASAEQLADPMFELFAASNLKTNVDGYQQGSTKWN